MAPAPLRSDTAASAERRRLLMRSLGRTALMLVLLLVLYFVVPARISGGRALAVLVPGLAIFGVLMVAQLRSVLASEHPAVRAGEALALAVPVLVVVFARAYLALSRSSPHSFTEHLDRVGALYFTVTTIGTVGYGDIAAKSDTARLMVTFQIALDFLVLVGLVRVFVFAARTGIQRRATPGDP